MWDRSIKNSKIANIAVKLQNVQNIITLPKITEECEKHLFNKMPKTALPGGCHAA